MFAPHENQQNSQEFADNLAALVKKVLPELDFELLAANKPSQRHKGDGPPRERNSFFIYKSHRWSHYRQQYKAAGKKIQVPEVTKKMSGDWHALSAQEQRKWRLAAILQQYNHRKANPNYKYNPNRNTQKKAAKRSRADGEGGRTRKKSRNEKSADSPSIESRGMILEPFSVHTQSIDDSFLLNNLIDDPIELQSLWKEFTNETELASAASTSSGTTSTTSNSTSNTTATTTTINTAEQAAPLVFNELTVEHPLVEEFNFIGYDATNLSQLPYNVEVNQFVDINQVYNAATPVSPTPTTPMLTSDIDISPMLQSISPILTESSPDSIVAQSFDENAGINISNLNNLEQVMYEQSFECDAFNSYAFDASQYLFSNQPYPDFELFDGSNATFDYAYSTRDPAVEDWTTLAVTDS